MGGGGGGGGRGEWGGGVGFIVSLTFLLLSFSVSRVITWKLYINITLKFDSWHLM